MATPKRKLHTLTVVVSAPAWLRKADLRREVRTLISESTVWGTERRGFGPLVYIDHGDIKARRVR